MMIVWKSVTRERNKIPRSPLLNPTEISLRGQLARRDYCSHAYLRVSPLFSPSRSLSDLALVDIGQQRDRNRRFLPPPSPSRGVSPEGNRIAGALPRAELRISRPRRISSRIHPDRINTNAQVGAGEIVGTYPGKRCTRG